MELEGTLQAWVQARELERRMPKDGGVENAVLPFLKWAGGKRWLMSLGSELSKTVEGTYVEPFLGSGAMFFALRPSKAHLSDANQALIATYAALKENWKGVLGRLKQHDRLHCSDHYYFMRSTKPRSPVGHAARFIYLNRTCWNGLYRVNRQGIFNVPIGTKKSALLDTDNFEEIARRLQNASFAHEDFSSSIARAGEGDLVFADPPYTVRHQYNGFVKYNQQLFSWADQERLFASLLAAKNRGARIVCTNADHSSIRALYGRNFEMISVGRYSSIAGRGGKRGQYAEVIIYG